MKKYVVYYAGGEPITSVYSTCISKACKAFMETLEKPSRYKRFTRMVGLICYKNNHSSFNDFVVIES